MAAYRSNCLQRRDGVLTARKHRSSFRRASVTLGVSLWLRPGLASDSLHVARMQVPCVVFRPSGQPDRGGRGKAGNVRGFGSTRGECCGGAGERQGFNSSRNIYFSFLFPSRLPLFKKLLHIFGRCPFRLTVG